MGSASSEAVDASGPVIIDAPGNQPDTRAFRFQRAVNIGAGTLDPFSNIRLRVGQTFFSDVLRLADTNCNDPEKTCVPLDNPRQVYTGRGTVLWREPGADGVERNRSSIADITMTVTYTKRGYLDGTQGTNCDLPANANVAVCERLRALDCYTPGDTTDLTCVTTRAEMFNPFPQRLPTITIRSTTDDPIREPGEDPAAFQSFDPVMYTRKLNGPLLYRQPSIPFTSETKHLRTNSGGGFTNFLNLRAAIDPGSTTIRKSRVYFTADASRPLADFSYLDASFDPDSGIANLCIAEVFLGEPVGDQILNPVRFFWRVEYGIGADGATASDVFETPLRTVLTNGLPFVANEACN